MSDLSFLHYLCCIAWNGTAAYRFEKKMRIERGGGPGYRGRYIDITSPSINLDSTWEGLVGLHVSIHELFLEQSRKGYPVVGKAPVLRMLEHMVILPSYKSTPNFTGVTT